MRVDIDAMTRGADPGTVTRLCRLTLRERQELLAPATNSIRPRIAPRAEDSKASQKRLDIRQVWTHRTDVAGLATIDRRAFHEFVTK